MIDVGRGCRRHRSALLDFAVGGLRGPGTPAALDHLDTCTRCRAEIEATVLAAAALRRLATDVSTAEPSSDAWPRLRDRVARRPAARLGFMSPVAGMAISLAIVVVAVVGAPGLPGSEPEAAGPISPVSADQLEPTEEAWLRERMDRARRSSATPVEGAAKAQAPPLSRGPSFLGPDGLGTPTASTPLGRAAPPTQIE